MADQWYYARNNQQHGPHSAAQMKEMAASGQLLPSDLVWKEGMAEWKPASTIKGLVSAGAALPPPLPSPNTSPLATLDPTDLFQRLWANKLLFFGLCLSVSLVMTAFLFLMVGPYAEGFFALVLRLALLLDFGLFLTVAAFGLGVLKRSSNHAQRKTWLHGHPRPFGEGHKTWTPADDSAPWVQFSIDCGFVSGDGTAGRFELNGQQPNETIRVILTGDSERTFRVVSMSSDQLVLDDNGKAIVYHRQRTASHSKPDAASSDANAASSSGTNILGTMLSFAFNHKCPQCKQRSGKVTNRKVARREQRVMSMPQGNQTVQQWMNVEWWQHDIQCEKCGHQWSETKQHVTKA